MSYVVKLIENEKPRNEYMRAYYKTEIEKLPKGTIIKKRVKNNEYYYLKYRRENKTVTDYIGKDTEKVEEIKNLINKRKHFEIMLSELEKEYGIIKKVLEGA